MWPCGLQHTGIGAWARRPISAYKMENDYVSGTMSSKNVKKWLPETAIQPYKNNGFVHVNKTATDSQHGYPGFLIKPWEKSRTGKMPPPWDRPASCAARSGPEYFTREPYKTNGKRALNLQYTCITMNDMMTKLRKTR